MVGLDTKKVACKDPFSIECEDWFSRKNQNRRYKSCFGPNMWPEHDYSKFRKKMLE